MTELNQGDLCPNCELIIVMPPELEPNCINCGEKLYDEDDYYPDEH